MSQKNNSNIEPSGFKKLFSPEKEAINIKKGSKRKKLFIFLLSLSLTMLLLASGIVLAFHYRGNLLFTESVKEAKPQIAEETVDINQEETKDGLTQRKMDGLWVDSKDANKYPVAVMVENLSTVRPQSGLSKALVVYETLAEGGITRFMAMYAGESAGEIKPVRSARPYYLEWASEYDALYAHCGGSPEALQMISAFNIKDLNQISESTRFFWRGPGSAPHNLYTSTDLLDLAIRDFGLEKSIPTYESWKFKDKLDPKKAPAIGKNVRIKFSSEGYSVEYQYIPETNDYIRFNPIGVAHTDALDGNQIRAENIIVQIVPPVWDLGEKSRINMDVTGSGKVIIFRDGEAIEGEWRKADRVSRTKFYQGDDEVELNRGKIWIEIVPEDREISY